MASSSSVIKKIKVNCSNGVVLEMEEALVNASSTMKRLMEETDSNVITLPDITSRTMCKIIEFMKKHADDCNASQSHEKSLKSWDAEFIKVGQDTIFDLILGARYLEIERLVDLGCKAIADKIKGKSIEEIRQIFNIKDDFTAEEKEENRRIYTLSNPEEEYWR